MLLYLSHHKINKELWDTCIEGSPNRMIYACSWYLDCVFPQWEAIADSNYQLVFPVTVNKKYGISYQFQPYFAQQLGIFSMQSINEDIVDGVIMNIPGKIKLIEINLNYFNNTQIYSDFIRRNLNLELSLAHPYEELRKRYSQNTKRNIQKAVNTDITIKPLFDVEEIITLFRENRGLTIEKMNEKAYAVLRKVVKEGRQRNCIQMLGAYTNKDELCAATVFLSGFGRNIFLFSGTNTIARETSAMFLLVDNFIRENAEKEEILDFEGSNDVNLARFYRGFGSSEVFYPHLRINRFPSLMKYLLRLVKG